MDDVWDEVWAEYDALHPEAGRSSPVCPGTDNHVGRAHGPATAVRLLRALVLALPVAACVFMPLHAARRLTDVIASSDQTALEQLVNWPTLQQSLMSSMQGQAAVTQQGAAAATFLTGMARDVTAGLDSASELMSAMQAHLFLQADGRADLDMRLKLVGPVHLQVDLRSRERADAEVSVVIAPRYDYPLRWQVVRIEFGPPPSL